MWKGKGTVKRQNHFEKEEYSGRNRSPHFQDLSNSDRNKDSVILWRDRHTDQWNRTRNQIYCKYHHTQVQSAYFDKGSKASQ